MSTPSQSGHPFEREGIAAYVPLALGSDRRLWALAIGAMALDILLTGIGLSLGLREANPIAARFIAEYGLLGAGFLLKGGAVAVGYSVSQLLPPAHRAIVPVGLGIPSSGAVLINAVTIVAIL